MDRSSRWLIAAVAFAAGWLGHAVFGARPLDSGAANRLLDDGWPGIAPGWWFDRFFGVDGPDRALVEIVDRLVPLALLGLIAVLVVAVVSGRASLVAALAFGIAGLLVLPWAARLVLGAPGLVGGYPVGGPDGWLGPLFGPTATLDSLASLIFFALIVALVVSVLNRGNGRGAASDRVDDRR